jgi:hypothetical protein
LIVFLILHHFRLRLPAVSEFGSHTKSRRLGIWLLQSCSTAFTPNPNSSANSGAMQKHPQWSRNLDLEISLSKIPPRLRRCMFVCLLAAKDLIVGCSLQQIRSQCCQAKTPDHRYVFTPWNRHMALRQSKRSVTLQRAKDEKQEYFYFFKFIYCNTYIYIALFFRKEVLFNRNSWKIFSKHFTIWILNHHNNHHHSNRWHSLALLWVRWWMAIKTTRILILLFKFHLFVLNQFQN